MHFLVYIDKENKKGILLLLPSREEIYGYFHKRTKELHHSLVFLLFILI